MTLMRVARFALLLGLPGLLLAGPGAPEDRPTGTDEIAGRLARHVAYLAGEDLEGRETGRPGIARAEEYLAGALTALGLTPIPGRDGPFVDFRLWSRDFDPDDTSLTIEGRHGPLEATLGVDFRPFDWSGDGRVEGRVVFAGYGISAPEHAYDDYAGLDAGGKIVLVLRHEPREGDPASSFDGTAETEHARFAAKAARARERGAVGMIVVTDPLNHPAADDLRVGRRLSLDPPATPPGASEGGPAQPLPAVQVSREVAERLLELGELDLAALQRAIDDGRPAAAFDLGGARATIAVGRAREARPVAARDVVVFLEGSDPALKDEWIVVGAHHDHLGGFPGEGDTVFNGADDNASGTAAVLELARQLDALETRPRRSVVFATFSGEEKGLLGSRALARDESFPISRVRFMLNLDMIGRNGERPLEVIGDGYGRGLRELVEGANAAVGLDLAFAGDRYAANSDHAAFREHGVPFLHLFSGVHDDYHGLGDQAERLDYARMARIVRLCRELLVGLGSADRIPRFVEHLDWLGATVEVVDGARGPEPRVTGVQPGSPAARAGLGVGERLEALDGAPFRNPDDAAARLRLIEAGARLRLTVSRDGERRELAFERARPGSLGIAPAEIDDATRSRHRLAPGEGVLVRTVVADGPASRAGLHAGDLLLRIGGVAVDPATLGARLAQLGAGRETTVELLRAGAPLRVVVNLGDASRR